VNTTTQRARSSTGDYVLGASEDERARLLAQGALHAPQARELFDRIGVGPGWRVLDVGCGPLGVLDLLAERVGPTGSVLGLDQDERMLRMAVASLAERGLGDVALVQAPAAHTGQQPEAFDLCHARLVLVNVPDPAQVVAEMVRVTRPGGWVAVQEVDWVSWTCEPDHPAWDRLVAAAQRVWQRAGMDVHIGRRLEGMLRAAGLVDVDARGHQKISRPGDLNQTLLPRFARICRERVLDTGELTAAEFDALLTELDEHLARPDTTVLDALVVQAWGRKPE
jgi:SAM-dependent methyltransferase